MSSIYTIDFSLAANRVSPPARRTPKYLAWIKSLLAPIQWLRTVIFDYYANGVSQTVAPFYKSDVHYSYGDLVVDIYDKVYRNKSDSGSIGISPPNEDVWMPVLDTYIGIRERLKYNSQRLVLEAILNKKFRLPQIIPLIDQEKIENVPLIYINNEFNNLETTYFYNHNEGYTGINFYMQVPSSGISPVPVYLYYESEFIPEQDFVVKVPNRLIAPNHLGLEAVQLQNRIYAETQLYAISGVTFKVVYYS